MRQVPRYFLMGSGRVSRHFQQYFSLLKIAFSLWHRSLLLEKLSEELTDCTHILILINDDQIEASIDQQLNATQAQLIHLVLTGPLVRQDEKTIKKNILPLVNDVFQPAYQSFVTCYQTMKERNVK